MWYRNTLHNSRFVIFLIIKLIWTEQCSSFTMRTVRTRDCCFFFSCKSKLKPLSYHWTNALPFVFGCVRKCLKYFTNSWFVTFPPFFNMKFRISAKDNSLGKDISTHYSLIWYFTLMQWRILSTIHDQRTWLSAMDWAWSRVYQWYFSTAHSFSTSMYV